MLKIRRPLGRLIFNMGIAIPGKTVFLIETASWNSWNTFPTKQINASVQMFICATNYSIRRVTVFDKTSLHNILLRLEPARLGVMSKSINQELIMNNGFKILMVFHMSVYMCIPLSDLTIAHINAAIELLLAFRSSASIWSCSYVIILHTVDTISYENLSRVT